MVWLRERGVAGAVEAWMRCAAAFWRRATGIGTSQHSDYNMVLPEGLERYSLKPSPPKGPSANKRQRARRDLGEIKSRRREEEESLGGGRRTGRRRDGELPAG